jgi:hypothetical protein
MWWCYTGLPPLPAPAKNVTALLSFGLYLVGAQALSRLDVEREPQQLHPHHVQGHNALCKDPQDGEDVKFKVLGRVNRPG